MLALNPYRTIAKNISSPCRYGQFFASLEVRERPELKGLPAVVGSDPNLDIHKLFFIATILCRSGEKQQQRFDRTDDDILAFKKWVISEKWCLFRVMVHLLHALHRVSSSQACYFSSL
jgi:hypothetical protein